MNKEQLKRLEWKQVKIRPIAKRIHHLTGEELPPIDDRWQVVGVNKDGVHLRVLRTDHGITLPYDHIREFMHDTECDGFLFLKVQVTLSGDRATKEPLLFAR